MLTTQEEKAEHEIAKRISPHMFRAVLSPKEEHWWLGMMSPIRCGSNLW